MLLILMIVMQLNCLKSWCQTNTDVPSTGEITKAYIEIDYIREANKKLIEHKYCPIIIAQKDTIINLEKIKYNILDSLYKDKLYRQSIIQQNIEQDLIKQEKRVKILSGTTVGAVAAFLLTLLIK